MKNLNKKAFAVIEYAVLFIIVIGAFIVMRAYIQRGVYNNWGQTGQSFAYGRQYDAQKSIECSYDEQFGVGWYDRNCFDSQMSTQQCDIQNSDCQSVIKGVIQGCAGGAAVTYCNQGTFNK